MANGVRILPLVGEIGVWEQINDVCLVRQVRQAAGREMHSPAYHR